MTNPFYNPEFENLVDKELIPFGVSIAPYKNAMEARGYTYNTRDNEFPPTPIFSTINPFNDTIRAAKNVLEIGCGVGRNLPIIMEETTAHYYGVDPNDDMTKYFWDIQPDKWKDRVTLCKTFEELPPEIKFDFVMVTFVFQHIGFRPPFGQMNVADITLQAMKYTTNGTVWFVLEHEREEIWQQRWMDMCGITPTVYFKPGGDYYDYGDGSRPTVGKLPYPEFISMTHRGNDNNLIIFQEVK